VPTLLRQAKRVGYFNQVLVLTTKTGVRHERAEEVFSGSREMYCIGWYTKHEQEYRASGERRTSSKFTYQRINAIRRK
jgi:hypothetical protein